MATATPRHFDSYGAVPAARSGPAHQAYQLLHVAFVVIPLLAGIDKFLHWMVDWDMYLCPLGRQIFGTHSHEFMLAVGAVEIVAGLGVAFWPRVFAYVVAAWLVGIIVNLLLAGTFFDIALRDFGLMLGALALGRLAAGLHGTAHTH